MQRNTIASILGSVVLWGAVAWSAPQPRHHRPVKAGATKLAAITAIEVYRDDGGLGGRSAGGGQQWTLRPDGTAVHTVSFNPRDMDEIGDSYIPKMSGTFNPDDFTQLARYLQTSRLLDLRAPRMPDDGSASVSVSLLRGGQRKSITISDAAPPSAVVTAGWVTLTLVRGITANIDWKDPAGHAINTGLRGHFVHTVAGLTADESYSIDSPIFEVRNAAGKVVTTLQVSTESGYFTRVLPPGTYQLAFKKLANTGATPHLPPQGYTWHAMPATVQVQGDSMTPVTISLVKTPGS